MSSKDEARIFVGGLSFETSDRKLEDVFRRFGKVLEAQVMLDRDTGRPRGFGFVTFADRRAMEDAIAEMHGQELNGRTISVNKAEPRMGSDDPGHDYRGGDRYSSGGRGGGYHGGGGRDRPLPAGSSDCFKCGRPGHWARECPSAGDDSDRSRFSSRTSRFGGGGRGDRFGGGDRYGGDRFIDDRYDGGRYGDRERDRGRDRVDSRDDRYGGGGRDRYVSDRYGSDRHPPSVGDHNYGGGTDRYPQNGYGKERIYDRDGLRGGPTRYESGGGYRSRPGPYDRPARGGRPSSYDR